jgi:hypothetical protein
MLALGCTGKNDTGTPSTTAIATPGPTVTASDTPALAPTLTPTPGPTPEADTWNVSNVSDPEATIDPSIADISNETDESADN